MPNTSVLCHAMLRCIGSANPPSELAVVMMTPRGCGGDMQEMLANSQQEVMYGNVWVVLAFVCPHAVLLRYMRKCSRSQRLTKYT